MATINNLKFHKVNQLPLEIELNSVYFVSNFEGFTIYVVDENGIPVKLDPNTDSNIYNVTHDLASDVTTEFQFGVIPPELPNTEIEIDYTITRGSLIESGILKITTDSSSIYRESTGANCGFDIEWSLHTDGSLTLEISDELNLGIDGIMICNVKLKTL